MGGEATGPEADERPLEHWLVYLLLLPPFTRHCTTPTRVKG